MTKEEVKWFLEQPSFLDILKKYIVQEFGENKLVTTDKVVIVYDEENEVTESLLGVAVIDGVVYYFSRSECSDGYVLDSFGCSNSMESSHIDDEVIRSFLQNLVDDKNIHTEFDFEKYQAIDEWYTDEEWFEDHKEQIMSVIQGELGYFYEEL